MNNCESNKILKGVLYALNPKLPLCNNHYITGKNIWLFSSFASVENTLSNITCNMNCKFNNLKGKLKM